MNVVMTLSKNRKHSALCVLLFVLLLFCGLSSCHYRQCILKTFDNVELQAEAGAARKCQRHSNIHTVTRTSEGEREWEKNIYTNVMSRLIRFSYLCALSVRPVHSCVIKNKSNNHNRGEKTARSHSRNCSIFLPSRSNDD